MNAAFWKGKTVLLTGHTGFKGGWLAHWLSDMGALVHGFSLEPPTEENFFTETRLVERMASSTQGDVRDLQKIKTAILTANPEFIFHLAAQPLVRDSYKIPVETFSTNVMGSVNVMEACRESDSVRAIVNVTTDKCYENKEWLWPYRENEALGGYDPYSASKACAEIASSAYRRSFFSEKKIKLASARAGNVIGGGDWAEDRLIPDFLRAIDAGEPLNIRSPNAIRPWQHVLEPLSGYLVLAEKLYRGGDVYAEPWNFGPNEDDAKPVSWIVETLCSQMSGASWTQNSHPQPHEAGLLRLDSSKAKALLGWLPRWNLETALIRTIEWQQAYRNKHDMAATTSQQIQAYVGK
jgi:CDP-glucose 4,6-dehydratase